MRKINVLFVDRRRRGRPEEGHPVAGDLRAGDPDVHRAEEQQEAEGAVRTIVAHQVGDSASIDYGRYQRFVDMERER